MRPSSAPPTSVQKGRKNLKNAAVRLAALLMCACGVDHEAGVARQRQELVAESDALVVKLQKVRETGSEAIAPAARELQTHLRAAPPELQTEVYSHLAQRTSEAVAGTQSLAPEQARYLLEQLGAAGAGDGSSLKQALAAGDWCYGWEKNLYCSLGLQICCYCVCGPRWCGSDCPFN